jgi:hypothetical protein
MGALTLMIIRHAEKPDESFPGSGFTEKGVEDKKSLVIRGWQRTGAWAALFGSRLGGTEYPTPDFIYAATPSGEENKGASNRPAETVAPLGEKLAKRVNVNTKFAQGQEDQLMREVLGLSGNVLVCWEHHAIIKGILPQIPSVQGRLPAKWNGDRFDVVLRFDGSSSSGPFAFRPLYPCLLSKDSSDPVG